jgi:aminoglycoside phosphotransferase (APT) family kinase protein
MTDEASAAGGQERQFDAELKRSSRDRSLVRVGLEKALATHHPEGSNFEVGEPEGTSATGMSSETLLFDAGWDGPNGRVAERLVARVAPSDTDVPVFPTYDLPGQFATIKAVSELSDVPVPNPWWCETDESFIGSPFFIMGRVDGVVPPDVPPYNFGESWLFHAGPEEQRRLQDSTVAVLAELHAIEDPEQNFPHLVGPWEGETALRRHFAKTEHWYRWAAADSGRSALVEKVFAHLLDTWPRHESPAVFCWGDSRIGNVMYDAFEPVAVLDWEMAAIAPPETDLFWLAYMHEMFEDMAVTYGFPNMPGFLAAEDVAATYERITGRAPRDLLWYRTYAALQLGIVYLRTGQRSVHFGEREAPGDADELLMNAAQLNRLMAS